MDRPATDPAGRPVALITGSARGIGRAIAERLCVDHDVVVHHRRSPEEAEHVVEALKRAGASAFAVAADLADIEQLDAAVDRVYERFGRLDTLVANGAATRFGTILSSRPHHLRKTFDTVVVSFVQLCRRLAEYPPERGRIVAISGLDARSGQPGHGVLGAAKAALEALVRSLAVELAPTGTTVNAVTPGAVETASLDAYFQNDQAARLAMLAGVPMGRFASPSDIAEAVAWIASPAAAYVTGQVITVDGGVSAEGGTWALFRHLWDQTN